MYYDMSPTSAFASSPSSTTSSSSSSSSSSGSPSFSPASSSSSFFSQTAPISIYPSATKSCAFPSWPRRNSIEAITESMASSYLSDDDLLFFSCDNDDDAAQDIQPSYHTVNLVGRPQQQQQIRAWAGNVKSSTDPSVPKKRRRSSRKAKKVIEKPMSPILEGPE